MKTGRERSLDNLKRGRPVGDRERANAKVAYDKALRDRDQASRSMQEAAFDSPDQVIRRLFAAAARAAERAYDKYNRTGQRDASLIDLSKEARQLADRLWQIIEHQDKMDSAGAVLAEMDARLEQAAAHLAGVFVPPTEPPARSGSPV